MKISVVGSINVDMVVVADRIPTKGETIHGDRVEFNAGGKGANQAVAASRIGGDVTMFGCVGDDDFGSQMKANLSDEGINTNSIKEIKGVNTGTALITVGEGDNCIVIVAGANAYVTKSYVDEIKAELVQSDMVMLQHEIPQETVEYVVDICNKHNIPVLLNPAPARTIDKTLVNKLTYITPNEHEANLIFGDHTACKRALQDNPEKLVITQGSRGVLAYQDGEELFVPSRKSQVADTTGAGDTFNGVFAYKRATGASMEEALLYANVAAGLSVERHGAQGGMPTAAQVERELNK